MYNSHLLMSLIIFQGSKFILKNSLLKGTHCVPFQNEKPQGKMNDIVQVLMLSQNHARGLPTFLWLYSEKGHTGDTREYPRDTMCPFCKRKDPRQSICLGMNFDVALNTNHGSDSSLAASFLKGTKCPF